MQINYCDKCGDPIKGNEIKWMLFLDKYIEVDPQEQYKPLKTKSSFRELPVEEYDRVICNDCKEILDLFFKLRFEKLLEAMEEIKKRYEDPSFDVKKIMLKVQENDKDKIR